MFTLLWCQAQTQPKKYTDVQLAAHCFISITSFHSVDEENAGGKKTHWGCWRALKWRHMPTDRLESSSRRLAVSCYPPFGLAEHTATFLTIYPGRYWDEPPWELGRVWDWEVEVAAVSLYCKAQLELSQWVQPGFGPGGSMQFQPTVRWGAILIFELFG